MQDEPPNCKQQHRRHFFPTRLIISYLLCILSPRTVFFALLSFFHSRCFSSFLSSSNRRRSARIPFRSAASNGKKTKGTRGIFRRNITTTTRDTFYVDARAKREEITFTSSLRYSASTINNRKRNGRKERAITNFRTAMGFNFSFFIKHSPRIAISRPDLSHSFLLLLLFKRLACRRKC